MTNKKPVISDTFWRYMTNIWCFISYIVIIYDFMYDGELNGILSPVLVIYCALLVVYAGVKEFERWHDYHKSKHPGELFVIGWTLLIIGLLLAKIIFHKAYPISSEIIATYLAVLSILAVTQKSKKMHTKKK
jgi:hypothetical protein